MALNETGFARKRLDEIKAQYDALAIEALGSVNTGADSVIGQLLGIFSEAVDNAEETLQNTYDAMYPFSATGTSLDGAVSYVGVTRLVDTETVATACAYGVEGTVILAGAEAHADIEYISTDDAIISRTNALDVSVEIDTLVNTIGTAYNMFVGGVSQSVVTTGSETKAQIIAAFAALYNTGNFIATASGETLRIVSKDGKTPFSITVDAKMSIKKLGSAIQFVAKVTGAYALPIGALVNIDSGQVSGWDSLTNLAIGATGNNVETDAELRARHATGVRGSGSATVEAIKARMLQDVPEVTSINIYENRTSIANVDGLPAHSYESIIQGGSDTDVAEELWLTKPAGIETYGNVTANVIDSAGGTQIIKFSRPTTKYAWLNIALTAYSEEVYPNSATVAIQEACLAYANANIGIGKDIILQRFHGSIYSAVNGIGEINIMAAITNLEGDTPIYGSVNIPLAKSEIAVFDISRITVSGI